MTTGPGETLSHYRLIEKIGEGGMGRVYRAWDQRLERSVAIKLISERLLSDESARARLLREARTASALSHPNICVIHEVGEADSIAYIAMEYVEGKPLSALIPPDGLPVETLLRYGTQVADALAHAHERGIVHRDLKCSNVVVTGEGRAKVLDFGLARRLEPVGRDEDVTRSVLSLTGEGSVVGTLHYLPPEVLRGSPADSRGDLWALGVMLFEMAAGHLPFRGRTPFEITSAILSETPSPFPSRVPAGLRGVILHALIKEPDQRYQRAGEVRAALEAIQASASTAPVAARPAAPRRRRTKATGPIRALAVLPLENLSGDPSQEFFVDGMTEALIARLAKIGTLRVISRTSVMLYKGVRKPLPEIARELKVDAVVEGSVLRLGGQVRITAQLIRAATDEHLWAETYDRGLSDVLALQSEVARAIAQEIQVTLTPREEASLAQARKVDPAAFEAYLRGRYSWNKRTDSGIKDAIGHFQQAIDKDPTYALPYAGLADCYSVLGFWGALSPRDSFARGKAAATKALELEKDLAEAHCSLAYALHHYDWDWAGAGKEYSRALELNPGYPTGHHWNSLLLVTQGRAREAVAEMEKAEELDPLSPIIMMAHAYVLYLGREYDRAIAQILRTLESHPDFWPGRGWLGLAYSQSGRHAEAIAECSRAVELSGGLPLMEAALGHARALAGDREGALRTVDHLLEVSRNKYVMPYCPALVYAGLGEADRTLEWLEKAVQERGNLLCFLSAEPVFDPVRSHPRFGDLRRRIGLPF